MSNFTKRTGRTFLGISSFQALAMFRRGLFYTYLSIYLRFFLHLSVTETTFFATFPMILNVVFQTFVWGGISDKYQKRKTLIIVGEISAALSTLFVWFLHTLPTNPHTTGYVIILGFSFVEIFWSMSNVGWTAIISDLYPEHQRAGVQGKLSSIGALGRIVGVWIGGLAYDGISMYYEGWGFQKGLLFFIASGVMIISTIPMLFVPEGGVTGQGKEEDRSMADESFQGCKEIVSYSKPFLVFLLAMVLINFGRNSVATIKAQYLVLDEGFNVSSRLLSYIVNIGSAAILIMGLLIGKISRRLNDAALLLCGALTAIVSLLGFGLAKGLTAIFVYNFLSGASEVVILASSYSYVSKLIPPDHRGRQFALFNASYFLSWGVGATLMAGPIVDLLIRSGFTQFFSYRMSFLAAAILVVMGMLLFFFANQTERGCSRVVSGPHTMKGDN